MNGLRRLLCWFVGHDPVFVPEWHDEGSPLYECARCGAMGVEGDE